MAHGAAGAGEPDHQTSMPTKPIERLMFAQGGLCFFCRKPLESADASVEHLVALTHGGHDNDENCVACCISLNRLFGRMSLKEKLQIVLNQKGCFSCPARTTTAAEVPKQSITTSTREEPRSRADKFALVVAGLRKRGPAKPGTVAKLINTIRCQLVELGESSNEAESLLQELVVRSYVKVSEEKVSYFLPQKGV
jgi:hypothetical protein